METPQSVAHRSQHRRGKPDLRRTVRRALANDGEPIDRAFTKSNEQPRRVVLLLDVDRPMRFWGRITNKIFLTGIRWTAYVQDAKKNLQSNEQKLAAAVARADAMHIDADENEGSKS